MAEFISGEQLGNEVYDIIYSARKQLLILSPYIKLDDYFKKEVFNHHKSNPELHLIIAFGKNEQRPEKSFNRQDFEYFKEFHNISIVYIPNLHAKFYANEEKGVVTSINLYDYSFKNNVEFGIISERKFLDLGRPSLDSQAWSTSIEILEKSQCVFARRPKYKKKLILGKDFLGSEILLDLTNELLHGEILPFHSITEYMSEGFIDIDKPRERISREEFENTKSDVKLAGNGRLLSGTVLGKTKGKKLVDVRRIMAEHGLVIDNKITKKGSELGITLKYSKSGDSWIVYPESLNSLL